MSNIVVLISGRGSNLKAICDTSLKSNIAAVISNQTEAPGILFAKNIRLNTHIIENQYNNRQQYDEQLAYTIDQYQPTLIVLAGFMRILSPWFVKRYYGKLINIHPSLLPAFSGTIHAQEEAFNARVKVTGATVHFVSPEVDKGPIIAQGIVNVFDNDNQIQLSNRILELEHIVYPFIINKFVNNEVQLTSNNLVSVIRNTSDDSWLGKFKPQIFY